MGHALGAPSRDTRALARIPPECRGEHRGIGNSACFSTETREGASALCWCAAVSLASLEETVFGAHSIPVHAL